MGIFDKIRGRGRIDDIEEARRLAEIENEARKRREEEDREARIRQRTEELRNEEAKGKGFSPINVTNIIKPSAPNFWYYFVALTIIIFVLGYFGWYKKILPEGLKINIFALGVYSGTLLLLAYIISGFISAITNPDSEIKSTNFIIALALLIWLWDLAPSYIGPFKIPYGGVPFQGFIWDWNAVLPTTLAAVLFSSAMFAFLYINMVYNIVKYDYLSFLLGFFFIIITNKLAQWYFPEQLAFTISIPYGNLLYLIISIIGALVILFLAYKKYGLAHKIPNFLSSLFMMFVFAFFWVNNGWLVNPKAIAHAFYIVFIFGFFYMVPREENPLVWRILLPSLLIVDFYGYGFLFGSEILFLQFIPVLVLFVVTYCYQKTKSLYALATFVIVVTIILILSLQATGYEGPAVTFTPREGGADLKGFIETLFGKTTELIESRLDFATGGLYRSQVEKNQFEPLGVYFDRVRAAQPRFYTDEDVTLWGTIKSRTLSDPVQVNFTCYRWSEGKRLGAEKDDVVEPSKFTVYTLEDKDVECTFRPNKFSAGTSTVTLSSTYNFATSAYQKVYFIDRDRMRAMVRESLDPFKEFGITDKAPVTVHTNGPVEIAVSIQYLIPVSGDTSTTPALGIRLKSRDKILDKNNKPLGEWKGKIRKINELVVLFPKGITLNEESCRPAKFKPYTSSDCSASCENIVLLKCRQSCDEFDNACTIDCAEADKKCKEECVGLFKGEANEENYNGYQLDVVDLYQKSKDEFKDIESGRNTDFTCRITPANDVLEKVPITTRFIRARARYDYLLEQSYSVTVEQAATPLSQAEIEVKVPEFNAQIPDQKYAEVFINRANKNEVTYSPIVFEAAKRYNVDYLFAKAIIQRESSWSPNAIGDGGDSIGLMQVGRATAKGIGCLSDWDKNPTSNIDCGVKYIRRLMDYRAQNELKEGLRNIAGGYNGGEGAMRYSKDIGHETETIWENPNNQGYAGTRAYVIDVMKYYDLMAKQLRTENPPPPAIKPMPPSDVKATDTANARNSLTITWTTSPTPDVRYGIYRYNNQNGESKAYYDIIGTSHIDTDGVVDGVEYYYRITAINDFEESDYVQTGIVKSIDDTII